MNRQLCAFLLLGLIAAASTGSSVNVDPVAIQTQIQQALQNTGGLKKGVIFRGNIGPIRYAGFTGPTAGGPGRAPGVFGAFGAAGKIPAREGFPGGYTSFGGFGGFQPNKGKGDFGGYGAPQGFGGYNFPAQFLNFQPSSTDGSSDNGGYGGTGIFGRYNYPAGSADIQPFSIERHSDNEGLGGNGGYDGAEGFKIPFPGGSLNFQPVSPGGTSETAPAVSEVSHVTSGTSEDVSVKSHGYNH